MGKRKTKQRKGNGKDDNYWKSQKREEENEAKIDAEKRKAIIEESRLSQEKWQRECKVVNQIVEEEKDKLTSKGFFIKKIVVDFFVDDTTSSFVIGLVILSLILLVVGFLAWLGISGYRKEINAKYKSSPEATIVEITKDVKEYEVFDKAEWEKYSGKPETKNKYKKKEKKTTYNLKWEYEIQGEKHVLVTHEKDFCFSSVGDKKTLQLYSEDGKNFKLRESSSLFSKLIILVYCIVSLLAVYAIICLVIQKIRFERQVQPRIREARKALE